jgi:hypothetical protein
MSEILIIVVGLVVLGNSGLMLATDSASYDSIIKKYPIVKAALIVTLIGLLIVIPWQLGAVARFEVSAVPWEVWSQESQLHGNLNGVLAAVINLIFLLWIFLLPGHLYANSVLKKTKERVIYPYIVNVLAGIILCTPSNPVHKLVEAFS